VREPPADDRCRDVTAKVALVTGAAQGIGRACVDAFAADGWKVIAVDVDEDGLGLLRKHHGSAVATLAGDVAERATSLRAVEEALRRYGRLDCAVANAGINLPKLIDDTTDDELDRLIDVNVRGPVYLAQAAHRRLADSGGNLVIVASKTGLVAQRNSPIYVATKGAAIQLARALALDWAPEGIRVNAICPGIVDTPMLHSFIEGLPDPETAWRENEKAQPLGRLARPEECAAAVLFVASEGASFISGVALPVDGGFTAE
jgi:NAD(P)-dependent dehydrogenase (short-subunit alcohol dehydrogenase family)